MHGKIKKSTVIALGAAVAAVGVAAHAQAQAADGTVTYVMSINDDGWGDYTPGAFAIYAIDGTVNGFTVTPNSIVANSGGVDGGIDNFNLTLTGGIVAGKTQDDIYSGTTYTTHSGTLTGKGQLRKNPYYSLTDTATENFGPQSVEAGFTYGSLHHDNSGTQVAAGQDTVGSPPSLNNVQNGNPQTLIIFGLGQSAGNMSTFANSSTGNNPGIPSGTEITGSNPASFPFSAPGTFTYAASTYLKGLLIADGQFTSAPSIDLANSTTGLLASYDEAYSSTVGGWAGAGSSTQLALITQTLGVPEPASVGLLGMGAMGLLARRRRRASESK